MLFNTYAFLLVFLPVAIVFQAAADRFPRLRNPALVALSLAFYSYWDIRFLPLMVVSILANWYLARAFVATRSRSLIIAGIAANLLVLGFFKYTNFLADNFAALGVPIGHVDIALPLGISFFTFHHIMYLVDLRAGRAPLYPLDRYALYICFFPQAISGPLARWSEVMDQFGRRMFRPGWEQRCMLGATFIVIGLLQKTLLADELTTRIDPIYAEALVDTVTDGKSWMALGFAFQIFFDFNGYSDIAIGLGLIFGIELPQNFDAPFRTTSIVSFWQRWHMTLARFLRDYMFTPLSRLPVGGRRHRVTRALFAILLTMALCGLWHGAGWNYILWGTLQGVAIVFATVWSRRMPSPPAIVGWAVTVAFFVLSGVLFRAGSLDAAWHVFAGLSDLPGANFHGRNTLILAALCAVLLPSSHEICRRLTERPSLALPAALAASLTVVFVLLGEANNVPFIYFQF